MMRSTIHVMLLAALASVSVAAAPAHAQQAPVRADLRPIDPGELDALRPLIPRGAVIVVRSLYGDATPCCTVYVRAHAPLELVRRAIATPEEYPSFMPALSGVDVLSRRGSRVAFRFQAHAAVFDVSADAMLHVVNDRRIDVSIAQSDIGVSSSRWELFADGPQDTIVAFTVWSDPSQGSWAIRQFTGDSSWGSATANIPVATALALGVRRRAEALAGHPQPIRPAQVAVAPHVLTPPAAGPWLDLTRATNIAVLTLTPDGSLEQITVAGAAANRGPEAMVRRLMTPEQYGVGMPWMRDATVLSRETNTVQFRLRLGAPLASSQGVIRGHVEPGGLTVQFVGESGAFTGELHRWDFVPYRSGTYEMYTAGADERHAPWPQRSFLGLDAWGAAGVLAYWDVVTIRSAFTGVD
jgi:hypothetical protein